VRPVAGAGTAWLGMGVWVGRPQAPPPLGELLAPRGLGGPASGCGDLELGGPFCGLLRAPREHRGLDALI
jgi:hypothetical protein